LKLIAKIFIILSVFITCSAKADIFTDLSDNDRLIIQKEIRAYILNNPEVIIEAVKSLENKTQEESDLSLIQSSYDELFNDNISWQGGNLNGDITIIEFLDYRCGYCRKAHNEVRKLIKSDKNIRLIIKEYPILGEKSTLSSRLAISVLQKSGPKYYKIVHDKLMTENINLNESSIIKLLENLNINASEVLGHINSNEVTNHLRRIRALGQRLKISGTPTFIIEENIIRGYVDYNQMKKIIKNIR
jgi:protein-disulfide isomerase|tara:strand:- start:2017 stop:2751 length:735 start_codon:yes stop_codon:yes gene_type:complete